MIKIALCLERVYEYELKVKTTLFSLELFS